MMTGKQMTLKFIRDGVYQADLYSKMNTSFCKYKERHFFYLLNVKCVTYIFISKVGLLKLNVVIKKLCGFSSR